MATAVETYESTGMVVLSSIATAIKLADDQGKVAKRVIVSRRDGLRLTVMQPEYWQRAVAHISRSLPSPVMISSSYVPDGAFILVFDDAVYHWPAQDLADMRGAPDAQT
jgi:hypothetical protein